MRRDLFLFLFTVPFTFAVGCGSDSHSEEPVPFSMRFAALADGAEVGCTDELTGFGPSGAASIGINDLRLYVSNIRFSDASGNAVHLSLDTNEFQYSSPAGSVALIDLTGNTEGSCGSGSVANAEGTARTNAVVTGTTHLHDVASVSFDVGVPQAVMKEVIASKTPEGAPSPLDEMYWSWNSGYRHFVFNFGIETPTAMGAGYVHIGSRDCAPMGGKALEDREVCGFLNTPAVAIDTFDLETDVVGIDLRSVLQGLDFVSPIYDPETFEVIGEGPGVECHSSPRQSDCPTIFGRMGLDMANGAANASTNHSFMRM